MRNPNVPGVIVRSICLRGKQGLDVLIPRQPSVQSLPIDAPVPVFIGYRPVPPDCAISHWRCCVTTTSADLSRSCA